MEVKLPKLIMLQATVLIDTKLFNHFLRFFFITIGSYLILFSETFTAIEKKILKEQCNKELTPPNNIRLEIYFGFMNSLKQKQVLVSVF